MFDQAIRLLLVRHGESEANRAGVFVGRDDVALTPRGLDQITTLAHSLSKLRVTALYSSPMKRAVASADLISKAVGIPMTLIPELIEQDFGLWDGLTIGEVGDRYGENLSAWFNGSIDVGPLEGENLAQVKTRCQQALQQIRDAHQPGDTVILVGHGAVLMTLICLVLDYPVKNLWRFRVQTGTVSQCWVYPNWASLDAMSLSQLP